MKRLTIITILELIMLSSPIAQCQDNFAISNDKKMYVSVSVVLGLNGR